LRDDGTLGEAPGSGAPHVEFADFDEDAEYDEYDEDEDADKDDEDEDDEGPVSGSSGDNQS
jgi:hypothetical protein